MRAAFVVVLLSTPAWSAERATCIEAIARARVLYPLARGAWPPARADVSITRDPAALTREQEARSVTAGGWVRRDGTFSAPHDITDVTFSRRGAVELGVAWPTQLSPRARAVALHGLEALLAPCAAATNPENP